MHRLDEQPASSVDELPRLYELHIRDQVDDVLSAAVDYALEGAEEGTLVWARTQTRGRVRSGEAWLSPPGGLHCALVLRPDVALPRLLELSLVAQVALGCAIAEQVSPLTELRYHWPDAILISRAKAAAFDLAVGPAPPGAGHDEPESVPEWAALGVNVNLLTAPPELGLAAASLRADGDAAVDAETLLVGFARQFLWWVNRWAEDGLAPVRQAWLQRPAGLDEPRRYKLRDGAVEATLRDLGPDGEAVLETTDGISRTVSLGELFAPGRAHRYPEGSAQ